MYKFEHKQNALVITFEGFFSPHEAESFIKDYKNTLAKIDPEKTNLVLDGRALVVSKQELVPTLAGCMKMYIADKFKKIFTVKFASAVTNTQIARIGREFGFMDKAALVSNVEEALAVAVKN